MDGDVVVSSRFFSYQVRGQKQSIYIIEDLVLGKQIKTHVHNLRPFIFSPTRVNPIEVVQQNEQEFMVKDIIAHRGDHHRRSSMETGYEPYKALMHVDKLHEYLQRHLVLVVGAED